MDPDLVRLILVVLGILLVAGIYLWDRYKRSVPRFRAVKRSPANVSVDPGIVDEVAPERAEPTMQDLVESIPEMRAEEPPQAVDPDDGAGSPDRLSTRIRRISATGRTRR